MKSYFVLTQRYFNYRNLTEALEILREVKLDKLWTLRILRKDFLLTSMECLEEADERDWQLQFNVIFVGEEGVDAGGLTREFFSLLFKTTGVFDNENFSVRADLLKKKTYHILGRITAKAIIFGHPGPRCLNAHIANYIINSKEPDIANVQIRDLPGDAAAAVQQVFNFFQSYYTLTYI